jgi:hypothetical protein
MLRRAQALLSVFLDTFRFSAAVSWQKRIRGRIICSVSECCEMPYALAKRPCLRA